MDIYTYSYTPTKREVTIAMVEFLFEKMQKSDSDGNNVYFMISGMMNNAGLDKEFDEWYKRKIEYAIRNMIKY